VQHVKEIQTRSSPPNPNRDLLFRSLISVTKPVVANEDVLTQEKWGEPRNEKKKKEKEKEI